VQAEYSAGQNGGFDAMLLRQAQRSYSVTSCIVLLAILCYSSYRSGISGQRTVSATTDQSSSLQASVLDPASTATSATPSPRQIASMIEGSYGVLLRLVKRKLHDRELAADLVNEAVAISLEQLRSGKLVKVDQGLIGYVFKVSMNLLRNHRRTKHNDIEARADSSALDNLTATATRDDSDDDRLKRLTREMLKSLNMARDREIVERFYLDEEDKETICRDLGVTSAQFNLVISRARHRMKRLLEARGLGRNDLLCVTLGLPLVGTCHMLQPFGQSVHVIATSWLCSIQSILVPACTACF
jgi:RNA polymerase sigma-70 factor, ECF subfamily